MSKSIRGFLSFLLVVQLVIPYPIFAAAVGEFTSVVGSVTQTRVTEVIKPVEKSPIEVKDVIATALTSSATMVFSDESMITLSENSELEIREFLFKDETRRGIFSMAVGKLTANVRKYIGGENIFEVRSPTVGVGVRGTGFEFVESLDKGKAVENQRMATVSCTDGSLNLSAFAPTGEVVSTAVLEAGQMAVIIGGVITVSAIVAAAGGGTAAAAAGGGGASTGLSTAAIAGIALGGAAVVGGAVAMGGGGGDDATPTPTPEPVPVTVTGTWKISAKCVNQPSDAIVATVTLNETSGGNFTGSGSGNDYNTGEPLQVSISGNYNSTSKVINITMTTTFAWSPCVRTDTASTTLTSNDTGYIATQTEWSGPSEECRSGISCSAEIRMVKQ